MERNPFLEKLIHTFISIPFNQMLGLQLTQIDHTHVVLSFDMKHDLIGNFLQGILHGGVISSVLDMAGGLLVMSTAINKYPNHSIDELVQIVGKCSTIDLQISYLRPGRGEAFLAKAYLMKAGSQITFTRMELLNQENVLIAMANGSYLLK